MKAYRPSSDPAPEPGSGLPGPGSQVPGPGSRVPAPSPRPPGILAIEIRRPTRSLFRSLKPFCVFGLRPRPPFIYNCVGTSPTRASWASELGCLKAYRASSDPAPEPVFGLPDPGSRVRRALGSELESLKAYRPSSDPAPARSPRPLLDPGSGSRVPGPGSRVPGPARPGFLCLKAYRPSSGPAPEPGIGLPDLGPRVPGPGPRAPGPGSQVPAPSPRPPDILGIEIRLTTRSPFRFLEPLRFRAPAAAALHL